MKSDTQDMSHSAPFFSIIVPVYNASPFIGKCLESILRQSFDDFEVILVNDGSTDESESICQKYVGLDNRIKLFSQKQSGVSVARNLGIKNSIGKYITFCDADDELMSDALRVFFCAVEETGADMVQSGYVQKYEDGTTDEICLKTRLVIGQHDTERMLIEENNSGYFGFIWNTAFRRSMIGNIMFPEDISWLEDNIFTRECLGNCNCLTLESRITYIHNIRSRISLGKCGEPHVIVKASLQEYNAQLALLSEGSPYTRVCEKSLYMRLCDALISTSSKKFDPKQRAEIRHLVFSSIGKNIGSILLFARVFIMKKGSQIKRML